MTCLVISKTHNQIAIDSRVTWQGEIRSDRYCKWVQCPKQEQFIFVSGEMGVIGNISDQWHKLKYDRKHLLKLFKKTLAKNNIAVYYDRISNALYEFYLKDGELMQLEIVDDLYCIGSGRRVAHGAMLANPELKPAEAVEIASKVVLDVGGIIEAIPMQINFETLQNVVDFQNESSKLVNS